MSELVGQDASAYPQRKVTAADWLKIALRTLIGEGVEQVRILPLAKKLGVSRSSFYWYFKDREDLLNKLLEYWKNKNSASIVSRSCRDSASITDALIYLFECWIDETIYDPRLDFAIREWARRSRKIKEIVVRSDDERVAAIAAMFRRHGFPDQDAFIRARIVYYMQIGYYSVDLHEALRARIANLAAYVRAFTGAEPGQPELQRFSRLTDEVERRRRSRR
jgi:AcrR family transcriptional regulator